MFSSSWIINFCSIIFEQAKRAQATQSVAFYVYLCFDRVELFASGIATGRCVFQSKDGGQYAECSQEPWRSSEGSGSSHEDHGPGKDTKGTKDTLSFRHPLHYCT